MFSVPFHCARSSLFWDQKYSITIIFVTIWYYWCNFPAFNNLRRRDTRANLLRDRWWAKLFELKFVSLIRPRALLFATNFFNLQHLFLLRDKLIMHGEKRETSTKTCNEIMLHDKLYLVFLELLETVRYVNYSQFDWHLANLYAAHVLSSHIRALFHMNTTER